jgi:hypothetical protein
MPNPLTGDFEAVLQLSGNTINRLMASMHQNAFTKPNLPSFPHSVRMRIGDDHMIEGVRGLVHLQVSVPRIELIHGVTDRFRLEVEVRAWFRPDPGTAPLPTFINGTVHAEYRIQDIDPACIGWGKLAADFLWIRLFKDSVRFQGTADEDLSALDSGIAIFSGDPAATDTANLAKITRQIAGLLATRFEATPHKVSKRFRRGSMRSLNAPIGGSAVALPIGLSGEPAGDIASINNLLLEDSDLAVGISVNYIMSLTGPMLDAVKNIHPTVPVHVDLPLKDFDTVYHVGVNPPTVEWEPHDSYALFKVTVHGWANTNSIAANATFDITQNIMLDFNAGTSRLQLTPFSPGVHVHSSGLYHGTVSDTVRDAILKVVPPIVQAACNNAQPALDAMTTRTQELSQQLRTLDDQAIVGLDQAQFLRDGMLLRGTIDLAPRHGPMVITEKTADREAHSALQSWIPGGRIDKFEWSWSWSGSGDPGSVNLMERFLLRRPPAKTGRWGMGIGLKAPLPGLDGWGYVCLKITGVRVDPVTGQFVPIQSAQRCTRFGYNIADGIRKGDRLFLRDMPELSQRVPFPELALVGPSRTPEAAGAANTLLLYVDKAWDGATAKVLERGLHDCGRYDAGLALLVLFREGVLEAAGPGLIEEVESFAREQGIAVLVNEDVRGGWSRALDLRTGTGEPGWAILNPNGSAVWTHQGRIESETLTDALDTHLRRSPAPAPAAFREGIEIGSQILSTALNPGYAELVESHCPPLPLGQVGSGGAVIAFVQKDSASSSAELRSLTAQTGQPDGRPGPVVVVVVDGAGERDIAALKNEFGSEIVAIPDPAGTITDRFGVGIWPTTVMLNEIGVVSGVESGVTARSHHGIGRPKSAF